MAIMNDIERIERRLKLHDGPNPARGLTYQCSTHTPSALRPGPVGERLRDRLAAIGYPLLTTAPANRGVVEVYPHPALVELAGA
jgi:predicted RNase H-like nuclease